MKVLKGTEKLTVNGKETDIEILDFWAWNNSDLLNNTLRGAYAEFLVSKALGVDTSMSRIDWDAYDVNYGPIRIEVKCSAYLQAWEQKQLSTIAFSIAPAQAWTPQDGYDGKPLRHSDFYIFCLLNCQDKEKVEPLNLDQWDFYVVPTKRIDEKCGKLKRLTLKVLESLSPDKCSFYELKSVVDRLWSESK